MIILLWLADSSLGLDDAVKAVPSPSGFSVLRRECSSLLDKEPLMLSHQHFEREGHFFWWGE